MILNSFFKKYSFLILFLWASTLFAQKNSIDTYWASKYHNAISLYNNKAYALAQKEFVAISKETKNQQSLVANADYYDAMCAVRLAQVNADSKVLDFVKNHPNSTKKQKAYMNVGNYYFANRKPAQALKWYTKVDEEFLTEDDKNEINFKMGYSLLVTKHLKDAKKRFEPLLSSAKYGNDSRYYFGYIAYKEKDYSTAEKALSKFADDATYKSKATYYLLDISFKNGRFEKCIEVGKKILPQANRKDKSEISKIIGESYFNLKKYAESIPYLENYKGKKGKWNNTDFYQLGYAYYKQKDINKAVKNFNKIIDEANPIAQNAYYHLGECYLKQGKKPEALTAFKSASEMEFNQKIKEDSALNYAKLSYEEGNPYEDVPVVLQNFLKTYPQSKEVNTIRDLLISSYLYQQDYQGALAYLDANKSPENNKLANEVSLYRGAQLFNEKKLQEAYPFFLIATDAEDTTIKNRAQFWMAECDFRFGNYDQALKRLLQVRTPDAVENNLRSYNIAYCYFKLKNYHEATKYFNQYINQTDNATDINDDAILRLGDSYFVTKNYNQAIATYTKAIEQGGAGADYALYQKGLSNGLANNNTQKIADLTNLVKNYKDSQLRDDALFQIATTYSQQKNHPKAHEAYNKLVRDIPKSAYVPNALLRQGLLFYNDGNNLEALTKFKKIVAQYPNSNEAKQAVSNARNVYIDIGKVDEYAVWVKDIKFINVTDADLDNATYESAENKFLDNNVPLAIEGFKKYLAKFPNGLNALKANFYLAQSYVRTNKHSNSVPHYEYVIQQNRSEYTEETLNKLSEIHLGNEEWNKAIPLLEQLTEVANHQQNKLYAESNLMKGYYEAKNYDKAIEYAEKVLAHERIDINLDEDAKATIARASFKKGDFQTAQEYFGAIEETAKGELKAETLYYKAFFKHENKAYQQSTEIVQKLIADYSTYKYWGVKSYIIMAKNYYALKDVYQATYILESIIKNFKQYEDVVEEAKNTLQTIKNNEAKTNESVNPKKN